MNRREVRRAVKEKRRALKKELAKSRAELKRKLAQTPAAKRRRRRRKLLLLLLLLLLLIRDCSCNPGPSSPHEPVKDPPPVAVPKKAKVKPKPIRAMLKKVDRPDYNPPALSKKPWLAEFQIQVAARSRRLAGCFEGVERPGAIRWSAALDPKPGVVSDHTFTPVLTSAELNNAQKKCLERVLEKPVYRLTVPEASAVPERVAMVLEF